MCFILVLGLLGLKGVRALYGFGKGRVVLVFGM